MKMLRTAMLLASFCTGAASILPAAAMQDEEAVPAEEGTPSAYNIVVVPDDEEDSSTWSEETENENNDMNDTADTNTDTDTNPSTDAETETDTDTASSYEWFKQDGFWYCKDIDGELLSGWQLIDDEMYYFYPNGTAKNIMAASCWIDGMYLDESGVAHTGMWRKTDSKWIYQINEEGDLAHGFMDIEGYTYWFDENGLMKTGWLDLDGTWYFFWSGGGMARNCFIGSDYVNEDGVWIPAYFQNINGQIKYNRGNDTYLQSGWKKNNGKWYFFENEVAVGGFRKVDGYTYYMDPISKIMQTGFQSIDGEDYYFKSSGEMQTANFTMGKAGYDVDSSGKITHSYARGMVPYYNQKDSRWRWEVFGSWNFGGSGCMICCLTSVLNFLLDNNNSPLVLARETYNGGVFNAPGIAGTESKVIPFVNNLYNITDCQYPVTSQEKLTSLLRQGNIVVCMMDAGTFVHPPYQHAIFCFGYKNGKAYVYDPLDQSRNGWYNISLLWEERIIEDTDPKLESFFGYPMYNY